MKKYILLLGLISFVVFIYLGAAHFSGGAFPTFGLPLGGVRAQLRKTSLQFIENIQFKDFQSASSYHHPDDQKNVDIPFLIWQVFKVKPEALDLMEYDIIFAKIDSSDLRARVKLRVKAQLLLNKRIEEQNIMLYFYREELSSPWYMKFEDSLRKLEKDEKKKG